jgi:hypothetical protein
VTDLADFPEIDRALDAIDEDTGARLIWERFPDVRPPHPHRIPERWRALAPPAETALRRLRETSVEDWETFLTGECAAQDAVRSRQGDLEEADRLMEGYFDGWPDEDAPQ